jgi:2'-5' RNA ligase
VTGPDGTERWRCFVAVPVPHDLRAALSAFVESLRLHPDADGWRWTDAGTWHLTLAFLGATEVKRVPELATGLAEVVIGIHAFSVATGGVGAFPGAQRARVLWYGIDDRDGRLRDVASRVSIAVGLPAPQTFQPHLTLARSRAERGGDARSLLVAAEPPRASLPITELVLYRSHLSRVPARYEALSRYQLGAAVPA